MGHIKSTALVLTCAVTIACGQASPTSPSSTALTAPVAPASLFEQRPFGALILSGTATLAHAGEYTTILVRVDPSVSAMRWTFGDGTTSALFRTTMTHFYQAAGTYHATLTVTTFSGQSETAEGDIGVLPAFAPSPTPQPQPPGFGVGLTASRVDVGTATSFMITLSGIAVSDVASASMVFGDGVSEAITTATPSHTYAVAGSYIAGLTVTDTAGRSQHVTTGVVVTVGSPPPGPPSLTLFVSVSAAPATFPSTVTIGVNAVSTPLPNLYEVDCENDGVFELSSPGNAMQCVYPAAGTYTVRVRATNGILTSTALSDPFIIVP